ncbi:MAG: MBL fold metallo-hydrolase [Phycisphaeraceae bacterium]
MMSLIEPVLKDDALVAQMRGTQPGDGLAIWWLGQSGFLVKSRTGCLLFDPYLSDSLTRKYADTDKPHVRMTAQAVDPAALDFVEVITSTHNHTDHLDAATLGPLLAANPTGKLVIPEANRAFVADRLGVEVDAPVGVGDGDVVDVAGFQIEGVPAAHEALERDEQGRPRFMGYIVRCGKWCVYHSGDTLLYDGLVERLREKRIDVAILPINGRRPERRVAGNLDGQQAAQLAHDIGARLVIPCHFEMFTFNTASPGLFEKSCRKLGQDHRVMRCGELLELGGEGRSMDDGQ